jgi:hypothetical protein
VGACGKADGDRLLQIMSRNCFRLHRAFLSASVLLCVFMASKQIDLSNPAKIGAELLKDPKGNFALDVWETYCSKPFAHLGPLYPLPVLSWRTDPSDPQFAPLDPQQAVDEAFTWVTQALMLLKSDQPAGAIEPVKRALKILALWR